MEFERFRVDFCAFVWHLRGFRRRLTCAPSLARSPVPLLDAALRYASANYAFQFFVFLVLFSYLVN